MSKKKTILMIVSLLLLSGVFIGIGVVVTSSTVADSGKQSAQAEEGANKTGR